MARPAKDSIKASVAIPIGSAGTISGTLTTPSKGGTNETNLTSSNSNVAVAVTWNPALVDKKFAANTAYTATVTVTPKSGLTFASNATIDAGSTGLVFGALTDGKFVATKTFDATADKTLSSIAVTTQPTKEDYKDGDRLNPDGMVVTATYDDTTTAEITDYTVSYPNGSSFQKDDTTATITYSGKTATVTGLTVNGKDADDLKAAYTSPSGAFTYTGADQATAIITALGGATATRPASDKVSFTFQKEGSETTSAAIQDAGTYKILATVSDDPHYADLSGIEIGEVTINKASAAVEWANAENKTYTGETFTLPTATVEGVGGDGTVGLTVTMTEPSLGTFRNAGSYTFTATTENGNYELTGDITKTVAVSAVTLDKSKIKSVGLTENKTYDGNATGENVTVTFNGVNSEAPTATADVTWSAATAGTDTFSLDNWGHVKLSGTDTDNYVIPDGSDFTGISNDKAGNHSIVQATYAASNLNTTVNVPTVKSTTKELTTTALLASNSTAGLAEGFKFKSGSVSKTGDLVSSATISADGAALNIVTKDGAVKNDASTITVGVESTNYAITETVTITVTAVDITYEWPDTASWVQTGKTFGAKNAELITIPATYANTSTDGNGGRHTGTITVKEPDAVQTAGSNAVTLVYTVNDSSDYNNVTVESSPILVTIERRPVSLTWAKDASDASDWALGGAYDSKTHTVTATVNNAVAGHDVNVAEYTNNTATNAGSYTATAATLSDSTNYTLAGATGNGFAWSIAKRPLTLSKDDGEGKVTVTGMTDKTYDGTTAATGSTPVIKIVGVGTDTALAATGTVAWSSANAGTNTVNVTAIVLSDSTNYTLTNTAVPGVSAGASITKAARTLTVTPSARTVYPNMTSDNTLTVTYQDLDGNAVLTPATSPNGAVKLAGAKSSADGSVIYTYTVTPVTDGNVTVTFGITEPENSNYSPAESKSATVTSKVELLSSVNVAAKQSDGATDDSGAHVAASVDGTTIKVTGLVTNSAGKIVVTPTVATGFTVSPENVTATVGSTEAGSFTVTSGESTIATYTVDISGVTVQEVDSAITLAETKAVTTTNAGEATAAALDNDATKVEGIAGAAAKTLVATADQTDSDTETKNAIIGKTGNDYVLDVTVDVGISVTADRTTDTSTKTLTLNITPTYTVTAYPKKADGTADKDDPAKKYDLITDGSLENTTLDNRVLVSVNLPGGFNPTVAKHTHGGIIEWLAVAMKGTVASWYQQSFSDVELIEDARSATVTYPDGSTVTYTAADIGKALNGENTSWVIGGNTYTTLSDELLTALSSGSSDDLKATTPSVGGGGGAVAGTANVNTAGGVTGGTVEYSATRARAGDKVTVTLKASEGYKAASVSVKDSKGNEVAVTANADGTYTFTMPSGEVTVTPVFEKIEQVPTGNFTDVIPGSFYEEAVTWAVTKGITNGKDSETTFKPNDTCTRAEAVTFLYRAAGEPEVALSETFKDVPTNAYYAKAVAWAIANGITNGKDAVDRFKPDDVCSRAEIVTFLARYENAASADSGRFVDVPSAEWYAGSVGWAVNQGITNGKDAENTFKPNDTCTRAEIVTFLYRDFVR